MNLLEKITKTQLLLLFMTLCFLLSLTLLFCRASSTAKGTDYSITATRRSEESTARKEVLVDINTASSEELQTLPGIGAATAQRIIDYREEHGPFLSVDDLVKVEGISRSTFEALRDHVTASRR